MCLQTLERGIDGVGAPYAYGFAIILLTVIVKAATFPLTQKQASSLLVSQGGASQSSFFGHKAHSPFDHCILRQE